MLPHERRVGLDHLALDVVGVEALHSWETTLDASNVVRSPIVESPFGWHLDVRAPDNIAVGLLAMKPEARGAVRLRSTHKCGHCRHVADRAIRLSRSRSANVRPTRTSGSGEVESIEG